MTMGSVKRKSVVSEINVTPFVDVILVLLIIFMITAPAMFSQTQLKLPKTKKVQSFSSPSKQIILFMMANGDIFLGKEKVMWKDIVSSLQKKLAISSQKMVFLKAHDRLEYGQVAKMLSLLKSEGIDQVSLVTEIEKKR
jgi:biopolymer transport protein ExbD